MTSKCVKCDKYDKLGQSGSIVRRPKTSSFLLLQFKTSPSSSSPQPSSSCGVKKWKAHLLLVVPMQPNQMRREEGWQGCPARKLHPCRSSPWRKLHPCSSSWSAGCCRVTSADTVKGKKTFAWKSLHALQPISFHPPLPLTGLVQIHLYYCRSPDLGSADFSQRWSDRSLWFIPFSKRLEGQFTGRYFVKLPLRGHLGSKGSKQPVIWRSVDFKSKWLVGSLMAHCVELGGTTQAVRVLVIWAPVVAHNYWRHWPISSSPGLGNPQPDTQTLNLSKHNIGTHLYVDLQVGTNKLTVLNNFVTWREILILN